MSEQQSVAGRSAILVVDDSKVIRIALQRILRGTHSVYEAADGEAAWALLQQHTDIGLVLTDLSMPGLDGHDLLLRIRDGDNGIPADLPVVIVTGQEGDEASTRDWVQVGANAVLTKPFVPERLREMVRELLPVEAGSSGREESEREKALRDEIERLRRELVLRQQSTDEREAQREIERLRAALSESRDEVTAALQRVDESESEREVLQEQLEAREFEMVALAAQAEVAEGVDGSRESEADELRRKMRELEIENVRLDHELVDLERDRARQQEQLADVQQQAERLRRERSEQCERAAVAERALDALKAEGLERDGAVSEHSQLLRRREQELAEAVQRNKVLRGRVSELELAVQGGPHAAAPFSGGGREPSLSAGDRAPEHPVIAAAPGLRAPPGPGRGSSRHGRLSGRRGLQIALLVTVAVIVALGTAIFFRNF